MHRSSTRTSTSAAALVVVALSTGYYTSTINNVEAFVSISPAANSHHPAGLASSSSSLRPAAASSFRRPPHTSQMQMSASNADEQRLDEYISSADLRATTRTLKAHPDISIPRDRFQKLFQAIETRTSEAEENNLNNRAELDMSMAQYPPTSPSRNEMTDLYTTLAELGHLRVFGAAGPRNDRPLPAMGSKVVTPTLLEQITDMDMISLTPKPTNTLLLGGIALAVAEGILSVSTGIDLNFLVLTTISLAFLDKLIVNGAVFETATRIVMPEYRKKILRHEAGHFLCAYLLGCPVEGCVLSSWAALQDARFGGRSTAVSAGTSFFDRDLSDEMNGMKPLSRNSIDRYSVIVMGGIAAEAINFGRADGGAGDEMALVRFLSSINPRGGGAVSWDADRIKNQARWGALQAVLLLRQYKASYDALVDALERGGDLGECIYAIEQAARESGEEPLEKPLGYIVERGLYGEWTDVPPSASTNQYANVSSAGDGDGGSSATSGTFAKFFDPAMPASEKKSTPQEPQEDVSASLEELKKAAEKRLEEIEGKLSEIEHKS